MSNNVRAKGKGRLSLFSASQRMSPKHVATPAAFKPSGVFEHTAELQSPIRFSLIFPPRRPGP